MFPLLAVDPGRDKCGLAVVDENGEILARRIAPAAAVETELPALARAWKIQQIVLGDSTSSRQWQERIQQWLPEIELKVVDEKHSTLEARVLYWQANPPRGWRKLVPLSLQAPPEPLDDFAAVVLARRWFSL
jgi:RNase H-fold protein (predicted Holliday junction resolvase)